METKQIFFNSSMPRSGSELFQRVINQNKSIYGSRTDAYLEFIYAARQNTKLTEFVAQDSAKMRKCFNSFCYGGLQGWANGLSEKPIVCLKSRGIAHYYEWFEEFMQEKPKVICMVRDLRQIISSMEKAFRKNRSMVEEVDNPAQMRGTILGDRVNQWLNTQPVGLALQRTMDLFNRGVAEHVCFVRFEDFTKNPKKEMKRVYSYLELPEYQHDFNDLPELDFEKSDLYGVYGDHNTQPKIVEVRKDYKEILGEEISNSILKNYLVYYKTFYPEIAQMVS